MTALPHYPFSSEKTEQKKKDTPSKLRWLQKAGLHRNEKLNIHDRVASKLEMRM